MNISVLGCGWLGKPLAAEFTKQGHAVRGSTTRQAKLQELQFEGIAAYTIKILPEGVMGDLTAFLSEARLLIIDIPPGLRSDLEADFIGKIDLLKQYIEKSPVEQVIFVSSTRVYADSEEFPRYTEEDEPNGTAENSLQLIAAEKTLKSGESFDTAILRFGGLLGPDRHPVNHLAGRKNIKDPKAPVNLIHRDDCIGIIEAIISEEAWGETFNAVYPEHPSKEEYYRQKAEELGLEKPEFDPSATSKGKEIRSVKLDSILNYAFKQPV
jgi:nucleoside-diphosphate-sugar epimerase